MDGVGAVGVGRAVDDMPRPAGRGRPVVLVPGERIGAISPGHHVGVAVAVEVHRVDGLRAVGVERAGVDDVERPDGGCRPVVLVPGELIGGVCRGHHVGVAVAVEVHRIDVPGAVGVGRAGVDDVERPDGRCRSVVLVPGELIGDPSCGHHIGVAIAVDVRRLDVPGAVGVGRAAVDDMQRPAGRCRPVVLVPGVLIEGISRGHHVGVAVAVEVHCVDFLGDVSGGRAAVDDAQGGALPAGDGVCERVVDELLGGGLVPLGPAWLGGVDGEGPGRRPGRDGQSVGATGADVPPVGLAVGERPRREGELDGVSAREGVDVRTVIEVHEPAVRPRTSASDRRIGGDETPHRVPLDLVLEKLAAAADRGRKRHRRGGGVGLLVVEHPGGEGRDRLGQTGGGEEDAETGRCQEQTHRALHAGGGVLPVTGRSALHDTQRSGLAHDSLLHCHGVKASCVPGRFGGAAAGGEDGLALELEAAKSLIRGGLPRATGIPVKGPGGGRGALPPDRGGGEPPCLGRRRPDPGLQPVSRASARAVRRPAPPGHAPLTVVVPGPASPPGGGLAPTGPVPGVGRRTARPFLT